MHTKQIFLILFLVLILGYSIYGSKFLWYVLEIINRLLPIQIFLLVAVSIISIVLTYTIGHRIYGINLK